MSIHRCTLDVDIDDTIAEWKIKIFEKLGTPMWAIFLVYAGKILDETKTICNYNMQRESTIHVLNKLDHKLTFKVSKRYQ